MILQLALVKNSRFKLTSNPLAESQCWRQHFIEVEAANWDNQLYRPIRRSGGTDNDSQAETKALPPVKTRLIPYFAWSNRGKSEMSVWIPRKD